MSTRPTPLEQIQSKDYAPCLLNEYKEIDRISFRVNSIHDPSVSIVIVCKSGDVLNFLCTS